MMQFDFIDSLFVNNIDTHIFKMILISWINILTLYAHSNIISTVKYL